MGVVLINATCISKEQFKDQHCIMFAHCPNVEVVEEAGFRACYALRNFYSKKLKSIHKDGFFACVSMTEISTENVEEMIRQSIAYC